MFSRWIIVSLALLCSSAIAAPPEFVRDWELLSHGQGPGMSGLVPLDLDSDGTPELALGAGNTTFGGNRFWSLQRFDPVSGTYRLTWQSPAYDSELNRLAGLVSDTGAQQVIVGLASGVLELWDPLLRQPITDTTLDGEILQIRVADADNDDDRELVVLTSTRLYLLNPGTLATEVVWVVPESQTDMVVADVDADPALEIVLSSGLVWHYDGSSLQTEWDYGSPFGFFLAAHDTDNDANAEIIGGERWYDIYGYDVETESRVWQIATDLDNDHLSVQDVTGDGVPELIYGESQGRDIVAHDLYSRNHVRTFTGTDRFGGVTDVLVIDSDNDGQQEMIYGSGINSTGADYFHVHDLATFTEEWRGEDINGPYHALDVGDVDGDGVLETVAISFESDSGYSDGTLRITNSESGDIEWQSPTDFFNGKAWTGIHDVAIGNVDADDAMEIVVVTDSLYDGAVYVIDGEQRVMENEWKYDSGSPLYQVEIADIDGDGDNEIVAVGGKENTGSPGTFVYFIDGTTGTVEWKSVSLSADWSDGWDLEVGNVDADEALEAVITVSNQVAVIDGVTRLMQLSAHSANTQGIALLDFSGDQANEILIGNANGALHRFDPVNETFTLVKNLCGSSLSALERLTELQVVFACRDSGTVGVYDAVAQAVDWSDPVPVSLAGDRDALVAWADAGALRFAVGGRDKVVTYLPSGENSAPSVQGASLSVHWRDTLAYQASAEDADGDDLVFYLGAAPPQGEVVWQNRVTGELTYTPTAPFTGEDQFEVLVSDGFAESAPATVRIQVTNSTPVATDMAITTHWQTPAQAFSDASDPDDDPLTYSLDSAPANGNVTVDASSGSFTYTPDTTTAKSDSFVVAVTDGAATTQTLRVSVTLQNNAPVGEAMSLGSVRGQTLYSKVQASDADGDTLTFAVAAVPEHGDVEIDADSGLMMYTPDDGFTGTDAFSYRADDGYSASVPATVTVEVFAPGETIVKEEEGGSPGGFLLAAVLALWFRSRRRIAV